MRLEKNWIVRQFYAVLGRFKQVRKYRENAEITQEQLEKDAQHSDWQVYNPCNPSFRSIIEQVLTIYGITYQKLHLAVWDVGLQSKEQITSEEESYMLSLLLPGLNGLTIYTSRPEHFMELAELQLQESGLVVELADKQSIRRYTNQLLLDYEQEETVRGHFPDKQTIYIPIYKRPWLISPNLDISVPIGYNTVIVKGTKMGIEERFQDRIEREFYAE